jgi:hypothetical protein
MAVNRRHQRDGVKDANRSELEVFHYEHPAKGGRGVEDEAKVKPVRSERLLALTRELEEVIPQYTDHAESKCNEHSERPRSHGDFLSVILDLAQVSPGVQLVVILEPALADVIAIVHVRNHDVSDTRISLCLRLTHRMPDSADH